MAAQLTNQAGFLQSLDGSIRQLLAKARVAWQAHLTYRATAAQLLALSAREREDIGLAGQDVNAVARRAVYGD